MTKTKIELPRQLEELKNKKIWVNYILIWNESKHSGKGGFDKPPVNPYTLRDGSPTDSSRWSTFDEAKEQIGKRATIFYKNKERVSLEISGVGLILDAVGLVGIDLDNVIYQKDGVSLIDRDAQEIIKYLDSYSEISPSGSGIHILTRGKKPSETVSKIKNRRSLEDGSQIITEYEIYDRGRYFTFTGETLKGCERGLEERQEQIDKVYRLFESRKEEELSRRRSHSNTNQTGGSSKRAVSSETDSQLWEKMFLSRNGEEIRRLFNGDLSVCKGDHSSCDLALCNHLAYWTNLDEERINRMFRQSALYRPKWDRDYIIPRYGQTYRDLTISTAISDKTIYQEELKRQRFRDPDTLSFAERVRQWNEQQKHE